MKDIKAFGELVVGNLVRTERHSDLDRSPQVKRPAQELAGLGMLRGVQPIQRAFLAAAPIGG